MFQFSRQPKPHVSFTGPSIPHATERNHQNVMRIADATTLNTHSLILVIRGSERMLRSILGMLEKSDGGGVDVEDVEEGLEGTWKTK